MMSDETRRDSLKEELLQQIQGLHRSQALFPAQSESTQAIDALVQQLEELNPNPEPLRAAALPLLLGNWQLIYASQGTVVTRRLADSQNMLPDIELKQVWQKLVMSSAGTLAVDNEAELEIPFLGHWRLTASGTWQVKDPQLAQVCFSAFSLQAIRLFGQKDWQLPALTVPILENLRREAAWTTSYLDFDLRVGRGASANIFVFCRQS